MKKKLFIVFIILVVFSVGGVLKYTDLLVSGVKPVNAWYTGYSYRKTITLDEALITGTTNLTNFPVLISMTDPSLKTTPNGGRLISSNGFDIIFTDFSDTKLDHEIESYNGATGEIVMWVKIPTLSYNTDTSIYMYYSNSSIGSSQENKTGVWSNGYAGVWHLGANLNDSTSNNNNATNPNNATVGVTSVAGKGITFSGAQRLLVANSASLHPSAVTVSMWAKRNGAQASFGKPFYNGQISTDPYGVFGFQTNNALDDTFGFQVSGNTTGQYTVPYSPTTLTDATWYYLAGSYSPSTVSMYVNTSVNTLASSGYAINTTDTIGTAIGGQYSGTSQGFAGTIDEVRVSNVVRTANWLQAEYAVSLQSSQGVGAGKFIESLGTEVFTAPTPTTPTIGIPTLASPPGWTNPTSSSVTLDAIVLSNNGAALLSRGFCYALTSVNPSPQHGGSGVTCTDEGGTAVSSFTLNVTTGLIASTGYSFKGFARNTAGYGYSSASTFSTTGLLPTGVTTQPASSISSYYATLNGTANPNNIATKGHFRLFNAPPANCNNDSGGFRYPALATDDIPVTPTDSSSHPFLYTIPQTSVNFLTPNVTYWYCAYATSTQGTVGATSPSIPFKTIDGPASPCDPPTLLIGTAPQIFTPPTNSACQIRGNIAGADTGSGTTNTATITLGVNTTIFVGPSQSYNIPAPYPSGSTVAIARGATPFTGPIYAHDTDGDKYMDDQTQYIGISPPAGYVRRNNLSTVYNYSNKLASSAASLDCNPSNANVYRILPNVQMVTDADNDGYSTAAAASSACVGDSSNINGRTYYKDTSNNLTWLASNAILGSPDCQDNPNGAPCVPINAVATNPSSQTQNNISWGVNGTGGAIPAATGYDIEWCSGSSSCTGQQGSGAVLSNVSSIYSHTGRTANTWYGYGVLAKNAAGNSAYSSKSYALTQPSCTNMTVYSDNDLDGYGNNGPDYAHGLTTKTAISSGTSLAINKPGDIQNGMFMIAAIEWTGGSNRSISAIPAGWTLINTINNSTNVGLSVYYKYASSEAASYTWTFSSSTGASQGFVTSFSNVATSAPIRGSGTGSSVLPAAVSYTSNDLGLKFVANATGSTGNYYYGHPIFGNESIDNTYINYFSNDALAGGYMKRPTTSSWSGQWNIQGGSDPGNHVSIAVAVKPLTQTTQVQCVQGSPTSGWSTSSNDCDDTTALYYQMNGSGYPDLDGDGINPTSPTSICSGSSLRTGVGVSSGTDCASQVSNSGDGWKWQNLTGFVDSDNDTYTIGSGVSTCSGTSLPTGYRASASGTADCYDSNSSAKPGQTAYFSTPYNGSSYDYNCDGSTTKQYSNGGTCALYNVCQNNASRSMQSFNGQSGCQIVSGGPYSPSCTNGGGSYGGTDPACGAIITFAGFIGCPVDIYYTGQCTGTAFREGWSEACR